MYHRTPTAVPWFPVYLVTAVTFRPSLLLTGLARRLEFVAGPPRDDFRQVGSLPSQGETEAGQQRVAAKVHIGAISVAGLVVPVGGVLLFLFQSPRRLVSLELVALPHAECRHPDSCQTLMIS